MADGFVRSVAAKGLQGSGLQFPSQPLEGPEWSKLVATVSLHRIPGLLAVAVYDGDLPVTAEQRHEAFVTHAKFMEVCLELESDLLHVADILNHCGLRFRVLKGPAF